MDGAGEVMGSEIMYTSTCGKDRLVGDVRWVLVPKSRIKIFGDCVSINRRLIGRISGMVLEKCLDVIDVIINSVHKVLF